jgi:NADH-quinone oxidoreductase subunit H
MLYNILLFIKPLILFLIIVVFLLISIAFFVILERHVMGYIHRRTGPNNVGFFGLLQAVADGLKLLVKESIFPRSSNFLIFLIAPVLTFTLTISNWAVIPFNEGWTAIDFEYGALYVLAISSLSVHTIIMSGWSSNSKYAFLGALRSAAQMISYEIPMGVCITSVVLLTGSLNFSNIVFAQQHIWYMFPLFPLFMIFFICILAETNRHPFDLPEAEAELVSGYNVEYSAMGFALFFLAEYGNIILMSTLITLLYVGGWVSPLFIGWIFPNILWMVLKIIFFMFLFGIVRMALPRYRYDQLMRLGWKIYLPITLMFLIILMVFYSLNYPYPII